MVELKKEEMMEVEGGWKEEAAVVAATVALFAAPFTGGISLGLFAFGSFILACNMYDS